MHLKRRLKLSFVHCTASQASPQYLSSRVSLKLIVYNQLLKRNLLPRQSLGYSHPSPYCTSIREPLLKSPSNLFHLPHVTLPACTPHRLQPLSTPRRLHCYGRQAFRFAQRFVPSLLVVLSPATFCLLTLPPLTQCVEVASLSLTGQTLLSGAPGLAHRLMRLCSLPPLTSLGAPLPNSVAQCVQHCRDRQTQT